MRLPFTDKWNSFWHVVFGAMSVYIPIIIPFFIGYQLIQGTLNDLVDIFEFIVGYCIVLCSKTYIKKLQNYLKTLF